MFNVQFFELLLRYGFHCGQMKFDRLNQKQFLEICDSFIENVLDCLRKIEGNKKYTHVCLVLKHLVSRLPRSIDMKRCFSHLSYFIGTRRGRLNTDTLEHLEPIRSVTGWGESDLSADEIMDLHLSDICWWFFP
ncbi:hypothetical protein MOUN0_M02586 [Monosporozyma unispora]